MAEQLPEITDEKIEKAALPEGRRANEEANMLRKKPRA